MRLYLVRHGETYWNSSSRIQGWVEVGLNGKGREQIQQIAKRLPTDESLDLAVSTLRRARESADILGRHVEVRRRWEMPRFRELNQGHWNGFRGETLERIDPERYRGWKSDPVSTSPPGGESLKQVRTRVKEGLQRLLRRARPPVVVVAHKVVNSLLAHLTGEWPLEDVMSSLPSNAALYEVQVESV